MRVTLLATAIAAASALGGTAAQARLKVGDVAPPFEATLMDGSKVRLSDLRGKVVVLNFWATWCAPCKRELPLLDSYYRARKEAGLRVFAVATEDSLPTFKLRPLFAVMALPAVRKIKGRYEVLDALPTNFIIDRRGIIRHAKAAAFDLKDLNDILVPLLSEPEPALP